jgi:SWI/SNF-related matrix-associated actin-dependent regulator of chromatin subfamily A member 5
LQSISIVAYLHEFRKIDGPHLVMVPKSTLSNWCNEFKRWCPVIRVLRYCPL